MIMKKLIRTLLCCLLFLLSTGMYAQKGLQIASVFQKYGNEKGATYVELSKMLSKTWDITHYRKPKKHYLTFTVAWKPIGNMPKRSKR